MVYGESPTSCNMYRHYNYIEHITLLSSSASLNTWQSGHGLQGWRGRFFCQTSLSSSCASGALNNSLESSFDWSASAACSGTLHSIKHLVENDSSTALN